MNETQKEPTSSGSERDDNVAEHGVEMPALIWDALNATHHAMATCLTSPKMLLESLNNRELTAKIENPKAFLETVSLLDRDLKTYSTRLSNINRLHGSRTGGSDDTDEQLDAIQIHERYIGWSESYTSVVLPSIAAIIDTLTEAGEKLDAERLQVSSPAVEMDKMLNQSQDTPQEQQHG